MEQVQYYGTQKNATVFVQQVGSYYAGSKNALMLLNKNEN